MKVRIKKAAAKVAEALKIIIHIRYKGQPLCGAFEVEDLRDWPKGHQWVDEDRRNEATCQACLKAYREHPIEPKDKTVEVVE